MIIDILEFNSILLAITGFSIGGGFIKLYTTIKKAHEQEELRFKKLEEALQGIYKDRLYANCKQAIENGYITVNELKNINSMYENYKNLGGNSFIQGLYNKTLEVKVIKGGI